MQSSFLLRSLKGYADDDLVRRTRSRRSNHLSLAMWRSVQEIDPPPLHRFLGRRFAEFLVKIVGKRAFITYRWLEILSPHEAEVLDTAIGLVLLVDLNTNLGR